MGPPCGWGRGQQKSGRAPPSPALPPLPPNPHPRTGLDNAWGPVQGEAPSVDTGRPGMWWDGPPGPLSQELWAPGQEEEGQPSTGGTSPPGRMGTGQGEGAGGGPGWEKLSAVGLGPGPGAQLSLRVWSRVGAQSRIGAQLGAVLIHSFTQPLVAKPWLCPLGPWQRWDVGFLCPINPCHWPCDGPARRRAPLLRH